MSIQVPAQVLEAFAVKAELSLPELSRLLGRDKKTLSSEREAGLLPVHIKGRGVERRHYVCTLADITEYYRRTGEACQSSASRIHLTTNSTSRSKVIAFSARPNAKMNVMLRKSRKRSALKLPDLSVKPSTQSEGP